MPSKERYHREKRPPVKFLSDEDKEFVRLLGKGMKRPQAFREAYSKHPTVQKYMDMKVQGVGGEPLAKTRHRIAQHAKDKVRTKHINSALQTYQRKMDTFSDLSVDTAIELVANARSEKVRADLAIEGMRHKVGTPVQKIAVQEKKTVTLTFSRPDDNVIDGEVIE